MAIVLEGAVACVTGGARGIGRATAKALARAGARVLIGDIDVDVAESTARAIGLRVQAARLDVADVASFEAFIERARALGPIDLLVNNAGIQRTGTFAEQTLASQHRELAINLGGVLTGTRLALPDMLERDRGHIVNIASMAGKMSVPGAAVYTASKFGVVSLSRAIRSEIVSSAVTITTILPAAVKTELTAGLDVRGVPQASPEAIAKAVLESCRHGRPEVTVPRWLAPVGAIEQVVPERAGEFVKRLVGARERITADNERTRAYRHRTSRS